MRLICPNCDAEYEVDDSLFPPEGRDVQCSNCEVTWFQKGDAPEEVVKEPGASFASQLGATVARGASSNHGNPRPKLDEAALSVIRDEVDRETKARQSAVGNLETQANLGLDDISDADSTSAARARVMRSQSDDTDLGLQTPPKPKAPDLAVWQETTKRELLPDVEEINSTLERAPAPKAEEIQTSKAVDQAELRDRGFRLGFGLSLMCAAALIVAYAYAPQLSYRFPNLQAPLMQYSEAVDMSRAWLEISTESMVEKMTVLIGTYGG